MQPVNENNLMSPTISHRLAISAEEVADLLGISRAMVWKLHSGGRLPRPIRLGRVVRWERRALEEWIAAGAPPRDRWENMRSNK